MKHKLRPRKKKGVELLCCKWCGLGCTPNLQAQLMATKCPGKDR